MLVLTVAAPDHVGDRPAAVLGGYTSAADPIGAIPPCRGSNPVVQCSMAS